MDGVSIGRLEGLYLTLMNGVVLCLAPLLCEGNGLLYYTLIYLLRTSLHFVLVVVLFDRKKACQRSSDLVSNFLHPTS